MPEPKISVVIPTYNSSKFITDTLDCLRKQTFKDFEAVVINDGSKDDTAQVISKYIISNQNLNIRFFNQENRGIAGARNRGVLESKSHYIAFLDHDDIWHPDKLNRCYEVFLKYPDIDLVCHNELMRDASGKIVQYLYHGPCASSMFKRLLFKGNYLSTSATVVKKKALIDIGLFREYPEFSTVEDYDLWIRLSKKYKFYFIEDVLGEYVVNNYNASLNSERHYNNLIKVLKLNFREYDKKTISDFCLINLRISKTYFIIARYFLNQKDIKKAFDYLLKALLQFFFCVSQ